MPWETGFHWIAYYDDIPPLDQRQGATYADIDRDRLAAFGLYDGDRLLVIVDFQNDANGSTDIGPKRLIWRLRHQQDSTGQNITVHLVGWQRKVTGVNIQSICYVNQLGEVVMGGQWMNNRPLRHAVVPLECEKDLQ